MLGRGISLPSNNEKYLLFSSAYQDIIGKLKLSFLGDVNHRASFPHFYDDQYIKWHIQRILRYIHIFDCLSDLVTFQASRFLCDL